jgi:hypothetical protein
VLYGSVVKLLALGSAGEVGGCNFSKRTDVPRAQPSHAASLIMVMFPVFVMFIPISGMIAVISLRQARREGARIHNRRLRDHYG